MKTLFVKESQLKKNLLKKYDGSQLRPLFIYENFNILGPACIAWVSSCDVSFDHMVDFEDKIEKSKICGDEMLHFMIEIFPAHLMSGVFLQRLLASQIKDILDQMTNQQFNLIRSGDDLYLLKKGQKKSKLSISIASVSAVSTLIHFAVNIKNSGTPVQTASLTDLNVPLKPFVEKVFNLLSSEYESIVFATQKVKPL